MRWATHSGAMSLATSVWSTAHTKLLSGDAFSVFQILSNKIKMVKNPKRQVLDQQFQDIEN